MDGDRAGGETSGRAHRHAPSTSQHGVECQPEQDQEAPAEEVSLHEETGHRDYVDCRDGQRDLDDPGPGLGTIEVERQVHGGSILLMKKLIRESYGEAEIGIVLDRLGTSNLPRHPEAA